jgi:hypothetical protein
MLLFLVTEEQSSRRREPTKAVRRLGNETQEGNEEALTAYVTTGKGWMRGLARESRMIPEWHCCSLFAETGLRKIGQWRAGTRKRIRPFALPVTSGCPHHSPDTRAPASEGKSPLFGSSLDRTESARVDGVIDFFVQLAVAQLLVMGGSPLRRPYRQNQACRDQQGRPELRPVRAVMVSADFKPHVAPSAGHIVRKPAPKDFLKEISTCLKAKRAGFNNPVIRHRLDAGGDVLPAALAFDDEVAESGIWPLKHEISIGEEKAKQLWILSQIDVLPPEADAGPQDADECNCYRASGEDQRPAPLNGDRFCRRPEGNDCSVVEPIGGPHQS